MSVDSAAYFASLTVGSVVESVNVFRYKHPNPRNETVTAVDETTITTSHATYSKPAQLRNGFTPRSAFKVLENNGFAERAIIAP